MPIVDLLALPPDGALIGLDPGAKTWGLAVSDAARIGATPLYTLKRTTLAADAPRLFDLFDDRRAVGVVIGLPLNMDGSSGPSAQSARALGRNLLGLRDIPIAYWDERLSTAMATRALLEADASRARRAQVVDAVAAAVILQGALDRLRADAAQRTP
jgi:putative Holliday junction resolvase